MPYYFTLVLGLALPLRFLIAELDLATAVAVAALTSLTEVAGRTSLPLRERLMSRVLKKWLNAEYIPRGDDMAHFVMFDSVSELWAILSGFIFMFWHGVYVENLTAAKLVGLLLPVLVQLGFEGGTYLVSMMLELRFGMPLEKALRTFRTRTLLVGVTVSVIFNIHYVYLRAMRPTHILACDRIYREVVAADMDPAMLDHLVDVCGPCHVERTCTGT